MKNSVSNAITAFILLNSKFVLSLFVGDGTYIEKLKLIAVDPTNLEFLNGLPIAFHPLAFYLGVNLLVLASMIITAKLLEITK